MSSNQDPPQRVRPCLDPCRRKRPAPKRYYYYYYYYCYYFNINNNKHDNDNTHYNNDNAANTTTRDSGARDAAAWRDLRRGPDRLATTASFSAKTFPSEILHGLIFWRVS